MVTHFLALKNHLLIVVKMWISIAKTTYLQKGGFCDIIKYNFTRKGNIYGEKERLSAEWTALFRF